MSLRIFVDGKREDVERFYNEILYPEFGRLRRDDLFRVTENDQKYREKKTKDTVERRLRGYCPSQRWEEGSDLFGKYEVEKGEPKEIGRDLERVTDVQVKIGLQGTHFEIKLFYDEFIEPKGGSLHGREGHGDIYESKRERIETLRGSFHRGECPKNVLIIYRQTERIDEKGRSAYNRAKR